MGAGRERLRLDALPLDCLSLVFAACSEADSLIALGQVCGRLRASFECCHAVQRERRALALRWRHEVDPETAERRSPCTVLRVRVRDEEEHSQQQQQLQRLFREFAGDHDGGDRLQIRIFQEYAYALVNCPPAELMQWYRRLTSAGYRVSFKRNAEVNLLIRRGVGNLWIDGISQHDIDQLMHHDERVLSACMSSNGHGLVLFKRKADALRALVSWNSGDSDHRHSGWTVRGVQSSTYGQRVAPVIKCTVYSSSSSSDELSASDVITAKAQGRAVFVDKLPLDVDANALAAQFRQVRYVRVFVDRHAGVSLGIAYIVWHVCAAALQAMRQPMRPFGLRMHYEPSFRFSLLVSKARDREAFQRIVVV